MIIILSSLPLFASNFKSYSVNLKANFIAKKDGSSTQLKSFTMKYGIYLAQESLVRNKPYCFYSDKSKVLTEYITKPAYQLCISNNNHAKLYEVSKKDFRYDYLPSYKINVKSININIINLENSKSCHKKAKNYKELNQKINECILPE